MENQNEASRKIIKVLPSLVSDVTHTLNYLVALWVLITCTVKRDLIGWERCSCVCRRSVAASVSPLPQWMSWSWIAMNFYNELLGFRTTVYQLRNSRCIHGNYAFSLWRCSLRNKWLKGCSDIQLAIRSSFCCCCEREIEFCQPTCRRKDCMLYCWP